MRISEFIANFMLWIHQKETDAKIDRLSGDLIKEKDQTKLNEIKKESVPDAFSDHNSIHSATLYYFRYFEAF